MRRWLTWTFGVVGVLLVGIVWELYKWAGPAEGLTVGAVDGETGSGVIVLPRTNDRSMPHVWTLFGRLFEPAIGGEGAPLWTVVLGGLGTTLGITAVGFVLGVVVGGLFALVMQRWRLAEWGLLPWIVVSQTVPLIAFAPVISSIGKQIDRGGFPWPEWFSVAVVASYLAFFPVAVGMLKGLNAPDRIHLELMHTYAAGYGKTLRKLRLPASVPYLLPALRLAAANAVVGAIVAEVSIGMAGGLGRQFISFASSASADPALPWAPMFGAIALGLVAAGSVAVLGAGLGKYRRAEVTG